MFPPNMHKPGAGPTGPAGPAMPAHAGPPPMAAGPSGPGPGLPSPGAGGALPPQLLQLIEMLLQKGLIGNPSGGGGEPSAPPDPRLIALAAAHGSAPQGMPPQLAALLAAHGGR